MGAREYIEFEVTDGSHAVLRICIMDVKLLTSHVKSWFFTDNSTSILVLLHFSSIQVSSTFFFCLFLFISFFSCAICFLRWKYMSKEKKSNTKTVVFSDTNFSNWIEKSRHLSFLTGRPIKDSDVLCIAIILYICICINRRHSTGASNGTRLRHVQMYVLDCKTRWSRTIELRYQNRVHLYALCNAHCPFKHETGAQPQSLHVSLNGHNIFACYLLFLRLINTQRTNCIFKLFSH